MGRKALVWVYRHEEDGVRVLLLERAKKDRGAWHPVTGNLEGEESFEAGALRELLEETGLRPERFVDLDLEHRFIIEGGRKPGDYVERAFAAEAPAGWDPRLSEEHEAHQWVTPEAASERVGFDHQRAALRRLVETTAKP